MKRVVILGAGGHGRVVADCLNAMAQTGAGVQFAGFVDSVPGENVIGTDSDLADLHARGEAVGFIVGVGSVRGGSGVRARLFDMAVNVGLEPVNVVHPSAMLAPDVALGRGVTILAGAILNTGARLDDNVIVNTGAIIDHDGEIAAHAHIAPGAVMSGGVRVGADTLVGVSACVRQSVTIGAGVTVGAGAVVVADVGDGATIVGNPARPLRGEG